MLIGDWVTLSSPHFRMYSNAPEPQRTQTLQQLEQEYALLAQVTDFVFIAKASVPRTLTEVVLFGSDAEADTLSGHLHSPYGLAFNDVSVRARLYLGRSDDAEARLTFRHELAHLWVSTHLPRAPAWLNEGLAEYLSTLRMTAGNIELGAVPPAYAELRDLPTVQDLQSMTHSQLNDRSIRRKYAGAAWALTHLMYRDSHYRAFLARYYALMRAPGNATHDAVWRAASVLLPAGKLEADLRSYAGKNTSDGKLIAAVADTVHLAAPVELSPAATQILFASFSDWTSKAGRARAASAIAAATKAASDDPSARFWLARYAELSGQPADAEKEYEALMASAPSEQPVLAKLALLDERPLSEEDAAPFVAALRKLPPSPSTLLALARLQRSRSQRLLSQCLWLNAAYFPCVVMASQNAFSAGKKEEGAVLQDFALKLLPHVVPTRELDTWSKRFVTRLGVHD